MTLRSLPLLKNQRVYNSVRNFLRVLGWVQWHISIDGDELNGVRADHSEARGTIDTCENLEARLARNTQSMNDIMPMMINR